MVNSIDLKIEIGFLVKKQSIVLNRDKTGPGQENNRIFL